MPKPIIKAIITNAASDMIFHYSLVQLNTPFKKSARRYPANATPSTMLPAALLLCLRQFITGKFSRNAISHILNSHCIG